MKKILLTALVVLALTGGYAFAQGGYDGGYGNGYGYGNMMGGYGMMGNGGYGRGYGMMGYGGYGNGYGMMGPGMMGYGGNGNGYGMMGPGMMGYGGYGNGYGRMGYGRYNNAPDNAPGYGWNAQNGWNPEKEQKFLNETVQLRKQLNDKRFDYFEAQRNPKTTRDQLIAIEKQIQDLQAKINDKAQSDR